MGFRGLGYRVEGFAVSGKEVLFEGSARASPI